MSIILCFICKSKCLRLKPVCRCSHVFSIREQWAENWATRHWQRKWLCQTETDTHSWLPDGYSRILRLYVFCPLGFWTMAPLRYAAKFDPFLSLGCAPTPSTLAQSKERKGSNFAIWQPCTHSILLSSPRFIVSSIHLLSKNTIMNTTFRFTSVFEKPPNTTTTDLEQSVERLSPNATWIELHLQNLQEDYDL